MHWFVVTNRKEAKIFVKKSEDELKMLEILENPLGDEKRQELVHKKAGRGVKSIGRIASVTYSHSQRRDPVEMAAIQFARQIAQYLEKASYDRAFDSLTIVAEPNFLGMLRKEMDPKIHKQVVDWIPKDLLKTPPAELANALNR